MKKELIRMSKQELNRLEVIHKVIDNLIKQKDAAELLSLSCRQVRTIIRKVKRHGDKAIVHNSRGKLSPRKFSNEFQKEVITIVKQKYNDFGPTFASEKLPENEGKKINKETLRQWMIEKLIWIPRKPLFSPCYNWTKG